MMGIRDSRCTHPNRKRRQETAAENLAARAARTAAQQLTRLDLGGHTARRERKRLSVLGGTPT